MDSRVNTVQWEGKFNRSWPDSVHSLRGLTTITHMFLFCRITRIFPRRFVSSPATITLYSNEKVKSNYFRIITFISGFQLVLWTYLSYFALFELNSDDPTTSRSRTNEQSNLPLSAHTAEENDTAQPISPPPPSSSLSTFSEKVVERFWSSKWRVGLSLLSLGAGLIFAVTACMYPLRVVQKLTYISNSQQLLKFVTYTPLGSTRSLAVPVGKVTCVTSDQRRATLTHLAVKVQGYPLFFLLDQQGTELNPQFHLIISKNS